MSYSPYSSNGGGNQSTSPLAFIPTQFPQIDIENLKQNNPYIHHKLTTFKPLKDFLNVSRVKLPSEFKDWQKRIATNLNYFNSNYHALVLGISVILLFRNWWLLISLALLSIGIILVNKYEKQIDDIRFQGHVVPLNKNYVYLALFALTLPVILFSSPFATLLSVVSISAAVVLVHASVMDTQSETSFNEHIV